MPSELHIYNTLTRRKDKFQPLNPPYVGMYVCGPTVYNDVHLGNCRTFISFDMIYRYLMHLGYKVRYVRNITDAGHLEGDRDEGEDKFSKKAKLEQLEPMEVVQKYTLSFHHVMSLFNTLPPSIEPTATGHICEQIEMTKKILDAGYAYEVNGTVYFDVEKYSKHYNYGELSNRKPEQLLEGTRELGGQDEKRGRLDFALWIKAKPEHLMRWPSPWGWGFPGWHIECSAMSTKYLGNTFDIHGGGMDLIPTHHTNEIAQSRACYHSEPVKYWIHTNMLTVNGVRMSKSAGNGFLPMELFTGNHPLLDRGYSPMTVRFFMMQTHYRSTLDFSNEALQAAEKGFRKLMFTLSNLKKLQYPESQENKHPQLDAEINQLCDRCKQYMDDDFNTAMTLANLFEMASRINAFFDRKLPLNSISKETFERLAQTYQTYILDVLGLKDEPPDMEKLLHGLMELIIKLRKQARDKKDFSTADHIRDELARLHIQLLDSREGTSWIIKND
ncbi:MAG: cysteine--tRNA ligase [Chitinophagales bacterium]|nr:MAG: cysteine--tRNA ligase [Chitinophagales bacterium]